MWQIIHHTNIKEVLEHIYDSIQYIHCILRYATLFLSLLNHKP